jgi:hypothetical protein
LLGNPAQACFVCASNVFLLLHLLEGDQHYANTLQDIQKGKGRMLCPQIVVQQKRKLEGISQMSVAIFSIY